MIAVNTSDARNERAVTAAPSLAFCLRTKGGVEVRSVALQQAVIASWTGRDRAALECRWTEMKAMGIARPPAAPMFYRVAAARVTTSSMLEVVGERTTGEVECVLLNLDGRLWVGVGSDHTDRMVEAQNAALSKQLCDKPVAGEFWSFDDVADHWDELCLRSFLTDTHGCRTPYQDGAVTAMLPPGELLSLLATASNNHGPAVASALFCGTLPTLGSIRGAARFEFELEDPVLRRRLAHSYDVVSLPSHLTS